MGDIKIKDGMDEPSKLEKLQLIEHWNNPLFVLMPNPNNFFVNGCVETFLTAKSLHEKVQTISKEDNMAYSQIPVIAAVDMVCQNHSKGLIIHGFEEGDVFLNKQELEPLKELAHSIIALQAAQAIVMKEGRLPKSFENRKLYLLGELPTALSKEEEYGHFDTMKIPGRTYDMVKLYLTKEQAEKYNARNFEIHSYTFNEIATYCGTRYGLFIEPQESFSLILDPQEN